MGARRIPRRFGVLASDLTQCGYLHMKNSIPHHIPVISAFVECVCLIAVLRNQPLDSSKIQDLIHNTLWLQGNRFTTSRGKVPYPAQMHSSISHVVCLFPQFVRVTVFACPEKWLGHLYLMSCDAYIHALSDALCHVASWLWSVYVLFLWLYGRPRGSCFHEFAWTNIQGCRVQSLNHVCPAQGRGRCQWPSAPYFVIKSWNVSMHELNYIQSQLWVYNRTSDDAVCFYAGVLVLVNVLLSGCGAPMVLPISTPLHTNDYRSVLF